MKVEVIKQFSVFMPNKPGALSRLAGLFGDKDINIQGIASEVRDDTGLVRIAVKGDTDLSGLLSKAGFSSVESDLLSVEAGDKAGELHRITAALGEGNVNITTVYGTSLGGQRARILFAVTNIEKAQRLLEDIDG